MKGIIPIFIMIVVALTSCGPDTLEGREYIAFVEDPENGLHLEKSLSSYSIQVQYRPTPYIAMMEERSTELSTELLKQKREELDGLQYYSMRIGTESSRTMLLENVEDEVEFANKLSYFIEHMQYDLSLVDGQDTLPCVLFHFERNYNLSKHNDVLLAFENIGSGAHADKTLIFNDRILGTGPVKFKIDGDAIASVPQLKVN
jgi:hypothetical protein